MTDIEQAIADKVAAAMRLHNLRQAHARLADVRSDLRGVTAILEDEADFTSRIATIIVNSIEPLMWKIETAIREGKA